MREDRLHWITNMRANDAYRGFVSDIFSFTMFHELLADTVGIPLGHYVHRPASLHTFPEDQPSIKKIIEAWATDGESNPESSCDRMPRLRHKSFCAHLDGVWLLHDDCLASGEWTRLSTMNDFDDDWWRWAGGVLQSFHQGSAPQ